MLHQSASGWDCCQISVKVVIARVCKLNMFEAGEMVEFARGKRAMDLNLKCKN